MGVTSVFGSNRRVTQCRRTATVACEAAAMPSFEASVGGGQPSARTPTAVMSGSVDARLSDVVIVWIGQDVLDYNVFMEHPAVKKVAQVVKGIVRLPNHCFPQTSLDADSGFEHLLDVDLLDCYRPEMRAEYAAKPASVGCCVSHRRAWNFANLYNCPSGQCSLRKISLYGIMLLSCSR